MNLNSFSFLFLCENVNCIHPQKKNEVISQDISNTKGFTKNDYMGRATVFVCYYNGKYWEIWVILENIYYGFSSCSSHSIFTFCCLYMPLEHVYSDFFVFFFFHHQFSHASLFHKHKHPYASFLRLLLRYWPFPFNGRIGCVSPNGWIDIPNVSYTLCIFSFFPFFTAFDGIVFHLIERNIHKEIDCCVDQTV